MKEVEIYTTQTCAYCAFAKKFFQENNIKYKEFDVGKDLEKRKEMIDKSGQMGVPVIKIGNEIIIGFDKQKISQLLSIK